MPAGFYTTSTAFLEVLAEAGVSYIFANLGSDHPGLVAPREVMEEIARLVRD